MLLHSVPLLRKTLSSHFRRPSKTNFATDLQERLCILALPAHFRICKLQIALAARETDPVSGHHLESKGCNAFSGECKCLQEGNRTLRAVRRVAGGWYRKPSLRHALSRRILSLWCKVASTSSRNVAVGLNN